MKDFTFYNPTRIEFGNGKENNIGQYINEYGLKKVLIVYGSERVKKSGLFDRVVASLTEKGIGYEQLGGVVSNPVLSKVKEGIQLAKEKQVDAVVAVGGGSVLDSVKAIAAGAKYDGDVWDFFVFKAFVQDALPLFSIITLAATGSEMNNGGVVMNEATKEKFALMAPSLFPKVSVISPILQSTVTREYLVYSAADIFAHCLDLYFSASYIPTFIKGHIENILKTVIRTTEILLDEPDNYEARGEFAWAATQALNGSTFTGVEGNSFDTHIVEHAMSALFNIAHGAGLSIVLPAWMKWHKEQNMAQYTRFAKEVFGVDGAEAGIDRLETWFKKIGTPVKLEEGNIPRNAIADLAENAHGLASNWGVGEKYTKEVITEILEMA
jgi:alcohol dehydrogenase YqhD (iron-dependent ADH family)